MFVSCCLITNCAEKLFAQLENLHILDDRPFLAPWRTLREMINKNYY